jgi:hypothetical protein
MELQSALVHTQTQKEKKTRSAAADAELFATALSDKNSSSFALVAARLPSEVWLE